MRRGLVWGVLAAVVVALSGCHGMPSAVSVRGDGVMAIPGGVIYDPANETVLVAKTAPGEEIMGVAWSPDGKQIAVVKWVPTEKPAPKEGEKPADEGTSGKRELWVCDEKWENWRVLVKDREVLMLGQWASNEEGVTFTVAEDDTCRLEGVNVATGEVMTLAKGVMPFHAIHPEGKGLAVWRAGPVLGGAEELGVRLMTLVTIDKEGEEGKSQATALAMGMLWVTWSRDGKRLLFTAAPVKVDLPLNKDGVSKTLLKQLEQPGLYAMEVETGKVKRLTRKTIAYAVESPDGKHILFTELDGKGKTKVGVMKSDGTGAKILDEVKWSEKKGEEGVATLAAVLAQSVWLSNERVLYYKNKEVGTEAEWGVSVWAIDIDGKNKEDLWEKIEKLLEANKEKQEEE